MQKLIRKIPPVLVPIVCGLIYLALCLGNIGSSIWFDEAYSAYLMRFDFGGIWNLTAMDVHPPLYYFVLKGWTMVFGPSDLALRMMSVLFGMIAILLLWLFVKYKYGIKPAAIATLFFALSPCLIRYGDEARMYTVVAALVIAGMYVLQLAINTKRKRWWVIYAAIMALGMYTHYFCALALIANLIYLIHIYGKKVFQKEIILSHVLAVILYIPWLPWLLKQVGSVQGGGFWIGEMTFAKLGHYISETLLYVEIGQVKNWLLVFMLALLVVFVVLTVRYRAKLGHLLYVTVVPLILLMLLSMPPLRPMFVPRYILYSMVMVGVIMGLDLAFLAWEIKAKKGLSGAKMPKVLMGWKGWVVFGLTFITLWGGELYGIHSVYALGNYNFDTRSYSYAKEVLADVINDFDNGENLPIIVDRNEWMLYYNLSVYSTPEHPIYFAEETMEYEYGAHEPMKQAELEYGGKIVSLDDFLRKHDKFILIGHTGAQAMQFPRDEYQVAEYFAPSHHENDTSGYIIARFERIK